MLSLRLALVVPALLLPSAVASADQPSNPLRFFEGRTETDGTVKVMFQKAYRTHSTGRGVIEPDGSLTLVQHVFDEGKPPHDRKWRVQPTGSGRFEAAMSEADGPVIIERIGDNFRFRYRMKGKLTVEQLMTPLPDGRTARNIGKVRRLGIVVATTTGTIRKV
jgi:hypothetical protein